MRANRGQMSLQVVDGNRDSDCKRSIFTRIHHSIWLARVVMRRNRRRRHQTSIALFIQAIHLQIFRRYRRLVATKVIFLDAEQMDLMDKKAHEKIMI